MRSILVLVFFYFPFLVFSQISSLELFRRNQLLSDSLNKYSFHFRTNSISSILISDSLQKSIYEVKSGEFISVLPVELLSVFQPQRPYLWGDRLLKPVAGNQFYFSGGFLYKKRFINLEFQPELITGSVNEYLAIPRNFSNDLILNSYYFFDRGDQPVEYPKGFLAQLWWGQSKVSLNYKSFEFGISTQNIWWGPGQWNSLIFSNNAKGFLHTTINTTKPVKTLIGNFEGQFLIGKLNSSNQAPTLNERWNTDFFRPLSAEWRYLNAFMFSYNPKWVPGLFVGLSRTVQLYNNFLGNQFLDYFPIFQAFQKVKYFKNGNSVEFDEKNQSQQVTVFGRFLIPSSKSELYFEFGRRDHAFNWRDFTLSPEHARAYNLGFVQLFDLPITNKLLQIKGEMTQQHESINRYIRYNHLDGGDTWHTNGQARGFTNDGQPLGVGIGLGSNVQTLEFSLVDGHNKIGFLLQRLENNQAFYYRSFLFDKTRKPWIDYSVGFLYDKQLGSLLLSSKLQVIHARNYQWQLDPQSTPEFPRGRNLTSVLAQVSAVYFWNGGIKRVRE